MPKDNPEAYSDPDSPHYMENVKADLRSKKGKKKMKNVPDVSGKKKAMQEAAKHEMTSKKKSE